MVNIFFCGLGKCKLKNKMFLFVKKCGKIEKV